MSTEPIELRTAVLEVRMILRGWEKAIVERVADRQAGVLSVEANAVAQTARVTYDSALISSQELRVAVEKCGYHCAGQSVPAHLRDPDAEPSGHTHSAPSHTHAAHPLEPAR